MTKTDFAESNPFKDELKKYAEKYKLPLPDPNLHGEDLKDMLKNLEMSDFIVKDLDKKFKGIGVDDDDYHMDDFKQPYNGVTEEMKLQAKEKCRKSLQKCSENKKKWNQWTKDEEEKMNNLLNQNATRSTPTIITGDTMKTEDCDKLNEKTRNSWAKGFLNNPSSLSLSSSSSSSSDSSLSQTVLSFLMFWSSQIHNFCITKLFIQNGRFPAMWVQVDLCVMSMFLTYSLRSLLSSYFLFDVGYYGSKVLYAGILCSFFYINNLSDELYQYGIAILMSSCNLIRLQKLFYEQFQFYFVLESVSIISIVSFLWSRKYLFDFLERKLLLEGKKTN